MAITIKDAKTILIQPARAKLVIFKIITSDDGLYRVRVRNFTQRFHAVHLALEDTSCPFSSAATSTPSKRSGRCRWSTGIGATDRC